MAGTAGVKNFLVRGALVLALLLPIYFVGAAMATRFGLINWQLGFVALTLGGGAILVLLTVLAGIVGLILSLIVKPRQGWRRALIALAIPIVGVGGVMGLMFSRGGATALIHDIVTDPAAPLTFSARVMQARAAVPGVNPVEANPRVGRGSEQYVRDVQRTTYPDIRPIELGKPASEAFEQALATARRLGWNVEYSDPATGRIEATVRTFWYGFTDDVAIQVAPADPGARIDLRSISRVGGGDAGANAARIRDFREAITSG
jgi:fatty-acyl-CoA synthase